VVRRLQLAWASIAAASQLKMESRQFGHRVQNFGQAELD